MRRTTFLDALCFVLSIYLLDNTLAFPIPFSSEREIIGKEVSAVENLRCDRRKFSSSVGSALSGMIFGLAIPPQSAVASNLPKSNGADLFKIGTIDALLPLIKIQNALQEAKSIIASSSSMELKELISQLSLVLHPIPKREESFKKMFDEFSDPVSYKQKYLDQNAFLVYYSRGFDGPNRPPIESGEIPKQILQYGARNEAWVAVDDLFVALQYASLSTPDESIAEIEESLNRALAAMDSYLQLAPPEQLEDGIRRLKK